MTERLLIVDDAPAFLEIASALLRADGFEVVGTAGDGRTAIALADALEIDIVVLDVGLPDMDGFAVATRLTQGRCPAPKVVLVSSRDWSELEDRVFRCGAAGFVHKADLEGEAVRRLVRERA